MRDRMLRALPLLALIAMLALPRGALGGELRLYDEAIAGDVDLGAYLDKGEVKYGSGYGNATTVEPGPAPSPYPSIHVWETGFEMLGQSYDVDGLRFINAGQYWVKNELALVLWKITIPAASQRAASEYQKDMTLSLWVDWNQDHVWSKNEEVMTHNLNMADMIPHEEPMTVWYLTGFRVPDLESMMAENARWWDWKKDIRKFWVRAVLAYDDPDVSPDGEQLFGETEDYRVSYLLMNKKTKEQ